MMSSVPVHVILEHKGLPTKYSAKKALNLHHRPLKKGSMIYIQNLRILLQINIIIKQ